ncbi:Autophagy-related protein 6 [Pleurostoma richardsiae]|uniref:Autophagy-related protein 6 n=1 Tax=Pleurostoma richardsiae TaxID=41990 RepID=A0AA38VMU9_9PEZI|nr:Autophagy-related protein 6 [Pleurostoma richardsiae]
MGWLDGLFGSSSEQDPLRKLDPKLREFLEKESPVKFRPSSDEQQVAEPRAQARPQQPGTTGPPAAAAADGKSTEGPAPLPSESLYQDGRYAHLWKSYRPLAAVEAETKTDHERLMDVLEGYKERKASIGRAALENCALEQVDWSNCMRSGDMVARMTMCRAEVKKFERCYMVQSRLLKALGYLSTHDRPPQVDEDIQMHADTLYQKMMEQEAAIEAAKAEGKPIPKFEPLFRRQNQQQQLAQGVVATEADDELAVLNPEAQKQWRQRLEKLPEADRETEEEAMRGELRAKVEVASKIEEFRQGKEEERKARKTQGSETITDKISSFFGK